MTHPLIARKFMALLGVHADYTPGDIITIRGKAYRFPSFTDVYNAARHGLKPYEVTTDRQGSKTGKQS